MLLQDFFLSPVWHLMLTPTTVLGLLLTSEVSSPANQIISNIISGKIRTFKTFSASYFEWDWKWWWMIRDLLRSNVCCSHHEHWHGSPPWFLLLDATKCRRVILIFMHSFSFKFSLIEFFCTLGSVPVQQHSSVFVIHNMSLNIWFLNFVWDYLHFVEYALCRCCLSAQPEILKAECSGCSVHGAKRFS